MPPNSGILNFCPYPPDASSSSNNAVSDNSIDEQIFVDPKIQYRGIGYCSLSEAAFAVLLEYYIPGFEIVPYRTFQIPLGFGRSADFLINDVIVEYHQPRLVPSRGKRGDYETKEEVQEYLRRASKFQRNSRKRKMLDRMTRERLRANYELRRLAQLQEHPHHREKELIVACSREEFYEKVICRFSIIETPPMDIFLIQFWKLVSHIADQNQGYSSKNRSSRRA